MKKAAFAAGGEAHLTEKLGPMITEALKYDGPALVELPVSRQELSMPPTMTLEQAKASACSCLKAVLSGRGDEDRSGASQSAAVIDCKNNPIGQRKDKQWRR